MAINITEKLSLLTTIEQKSFDRLVPKIIYCINDAVYENISKGNTFSSIDLGIGVLNILIEDNEVKYKFIPSKELETSVNSTIINKENLLVDKLEKSLVNKFVNIYKDLL